MARSGRTFKTKNSQARIKKILMALVKPMTSAKLCEVIPMSKETGNSYLSYLLDKGLLEISGRIIKPGAPAVIYSLAKEDVGE